MRCIGKVRVAVFSAALVLAIPVADVKAQKQDSGDADLRIRINGDLCKKFTDHVPSADVAYKPGVDARGRPVAPAEIGGSKPSFLPKTIEFPVTVDVFERVGQVVPPGVDGKLNVGAVRLDGNRVLFNGIDIASSEDVMLACKGARMR